MDFTGRDISILISMSLAVILMTIIFNGMGITNEATNENEIPEFSLDSGNFDFAGSFPDNPGTSSQNRLKWNNDLQNSMQNTVWLDGDTNGGTEMFISISNGTQDSHIDVRINQWDSGNVVGFDEYTLNETGDSVIHQNLSASSVYNIELTYWGIENNGESDVTVTMRYTIENQPESGGGFLDRIPIVGGILSTGEALASAVMWFGSVIYWIIAAAITIIINAITVIVSTVIFTIDLLSWISTSYFDIVNHSSSFASIFLVIPGLLVFVEYLKLAFVVTDLIWLG